MRCFDKSKQCHLSESNYPPLGRIRGRYKSIKEKFFNRKKYAGLLPQAVAGPDLRFLDIDIRHPSGLGDWNAWKASCLFASHREGRSPVHRVCFFLGDSGYYAHELLLTPYSRLPCYDVRQLNFNHLHARARCKIESAFGVLKMRFPRLYTERTVGVLLELVRSVMLAAAIIHNLCCERRDHLMKDHVVHGLMADDDGCIEHSVTETVRTTNYGEAVVGSRAPEGVQPIAVGEWGYQQRLVTAMNEESLHEPHRLASSYNPDIADEILGVTKESFFCAERRDAIKERLPILRSSATNRYIQCQACDVAA